MDPNINKIKIIKIMLRIYFFFNTIFYNTNIKIVNFFHKFKLVHIISKLKVKYKLDVFQIKQY